MPKRKSMILTTEESGDFSNITAKKLHEILEPDAFGSFAILAATEGKFLQAGNDWQPTAECEDFMQSTGSDPWVLEYREDGKQFRAMQHVTLDQVREAFESYLNGSSDWHTAFTWRKLKL